jgi:hypothetical protein
MRDRRVIAVAAAGVVAVVAIVVVVLTALQPVPEFAALAGSSETGFVAYVRDEGDGPGTIAVVDLGTGASVDVEAGRDHDVVGWDEQGNLLVREFGPTTDRIVVVEPSTGERVRTDTGADAEVLDPVEYAWSRHEDGRLVIERDSDGRTASFTAPDSYEVPTASAMGDDRVVFVDELGRVAVAGLGEDVTPVLVAEGAAPWWQVVGRP